MLQTIRSFLSIPQIYQCWGNAVGGSKSVKTLVREYICPKQSDKILEIGCGPGTLFRYLPESGYLGFDLSEQYIQQAKRRFPNAQFICERVSKFSLSNPHSFDLVLAIGIVHHLDDSEALQLFQIADLALRPGGRLLTVDGVFTDDQNPLARWLLKRDRGEYVRRENEYLNIATQVFDNVEPSVRHDLLRIPYSHLILQCSQAIQSSTENVAVWSGNAGEEREHSH